MFFFFKWQNIINQQARARRTNKLGWTKKYKEGEIGCHINIGSKKNPLKTTPKQLNKPLVISTIGDL